MNRFHYFKSVMTGGLLVLGIAGALVLSARDSRGQPRNLHDHIIAIPGAKVSAAQGSSVAVAGAPESPSISSEKLKPDIKPPPY